MQVIELNYQNTYVITPARAVMNKSH